MFYCLVWKYYHGYQIRFHKHTQFNFQSGELLLHMMMKNDLKLSNFVQCPHHNKGYCKFRDQCRYQLFFTICSKSVCRDNKCQKRHPKTCRNGEKCRFHVLKVCAYKHSIESVSEKKEKYKNRITPKRNGKIIVVIKQDCKTGLMR